MSTLRTERVRPARARRAASRRRRRSILLFLGLPVLITALVIGVWWLTTSGPLASDPDTPAGEADQTLTVLAYRGEQTGVAVLATSASGEREPVILVVPTNIIVSVPGHGDGPLADAIAAGAKVTETTVANLLGLPFHQHGVLTPESLEAFGDDVGAIAVDLGTRVTVEDRVVGPGVETLSGEEVVAYLDGTDDPLEVTLRFEEVLTGIVRAAGTNPGALQRAVEDASDGFAAAVAKVPPETVIEELPIKDAGGGIGSMDKPRAEELIGQLFSKPTDQVASVVLLNGNGVPGIGASLAERIVPSGFRVVVSTNARSFDFETTQIVVRDEKLMDIGRRLRSLLGVGQVSVGEASTGLADITVLIGRDFTAE